MNDGKKGVNPARKQPRNNRSAWMLTQLFNSMILKSDSLSLIWASLLAKIQFLFLFYHKSKDVRLEFMNSFVYQSHIWGHQSDW